MVNTKKLKTHYQLFLYAATTTAYFISFPARNIAKFKERSKEFRINNKHRLFSLHNPGLLCSIPVSTPQSKEDRDFFSKVSHETMIYIKQHNQQVFKLLSIFIKLILLLLLLSIPCSFPIPYFYFLPRVAAILNFVFITHFKKKIVCTRKQYIVSVSFA